MWLFQFCGWHKEGWFEIQHLPIWTPAGIPLFLHTKHRSRARHRATGPARTGQPLLAWPCNAVAMQWFPSWWHPGSNSNPWAGSGCLQHLQGGHEKTPFVHEERNCQGSMGTGQEERRVGMVFGSHWAQHASLGLKREKNPQNTPKLWSAWPDNTAVIKMHIYWNKDLLWRLAHLCPGQNLWCLHSESHL